MMKASKKLRELLTKKELLIAPAAYDALSAKIIEAAGFKLMAITGYGVSAESEVYPSGKPVPRGGNLPDRPRRSELSEKRL